MIKDICLISEIFSLKNIINSTEFQSNWCCHGLKFIKIKEKFIKIIKNWF